MYDLYNAKTRGLISANQTAEAIAARFHICPDNTATGVVEQGWDAGLNDDGQYETWVPSGEIPDWEVIDAALIEYNEPAHSTFPISLTTRRSATRHRTWMAETSLTMARRLIARAERDLGPLTNGQRRDLLADRTVWSMETIKHVVEALAQARATGRSEP
jgi:hypothetical protein